MTFADIHTYIHTAPIIYKSSSPPPPPSSSSAPPPSSSYPGVATVAGETSWVAY